MRSYMFPAAEKTVPKAGDILLQLRYEPKTVQRYKETACNFVCGKYNWDDAVRIIF